MKKLSTMTKFFNFSILILCSLSLPLASCGTKGKLKTPDQIEAQAIKKANKEAKKRL